MNLIIAEILFYQKIWILISGMSSSGEKKYKYFTDYKENNQKINDSSKMSTYVKCYDDETK